MARRTLLPLLRGCLLHHLDGGFGGSADAAMAEEAGVPASRAVGSSPARLLGEGEGEGEGLYLRHSVWPRLGPRNLGPWS